MSQFLHWEMGMTKYYASAEIRNIGEGGSMAGNKLMNYFGHAEFERPVTQPREATQWVVKNTVVPPLSSVDTNVPRPRVDA